MTSTVSSSTSRSGIVRHGVVVLGGVEDQRPAPVLEQVRRGGRLLEHGPARREVAAQHGGPGPGGLQRLGHGLDDLGVPAHGVGHVVAGLEPVTVIASACSSPLSASSRITAGSATRVAEVLHEVPAVRLQVDQGRDVAGQRVEVVERQRHAQPAGDGQQVDDRVGRSADGRVRTDGVLERRPGHDGRGPQVVLDQADDQLPGLLGDLVPARVDRGPGGRVRAAACRAPRPCDAMVDAVPIVMQCPLDRAMQPSAKAHSSCGHPAGLHLARTSTRPCPNRRPCPGTCR